MFLCNAFIIFQEIKNYHYHYSQVDSSWSSVGKDSCIIHIWQTLNPGLLSWKKKDCWYTEREKFSLATSVLKMVLFAVSSWYWRNQQNVTAKNCQNNLQCPLAFGNVMSQMFALQWPQTLQNNNINVWYQIQCLPIKSYCLL